MPVPDCPIKEELDHGATFRNATMFAVTHVGAALATSAGTSIVGIAMLTLTEFGKFREAGVAISFGLFIALICIRLWGKNSGHDVYVWPLDFLARCPA